jgi:beta-lactam-binding protein with PASTA domain
MVGALVLSLLAVVGSGYALWRTFDVQSNHTSTPTTTTAVPGGPLLVEVPSEINKHGMGAAAELANLKFTVTVTSGPSVTTKRDYVMNQDPAPGTMVPEGSEVQLKISSGPV